MTSELNSYELRALRIINGDEKGEFGAWFNACCGRLKSLGYVTTIPYRITPKGKDYLSGVGEIAAPDAPELEAGRITKKPDNHIWVKCPNCPNSITHQYFDYCGVCPKCSNTLIQCDAPTPDVPELVRYDPNGKGYPWFEMEKGNEGDYVLYSQAAEIIAAKDKELNKLNVYNDSYRNQIIELREALQAAEAKSAEKP